MPISGSSSYPATINEFVAHWSQADAALSPNSIVLANGASVDTLESLGEDLSDKRDEVEAALNGREIARGDVELKKSAIQVRVVQFNDKVRAFFPDTQWLNALPEAPRTSSAEGVFLSPVADASNLWTRINADPNTAAPITLLGAYDQATFAVDIAALKSAYGTLDTAGTNLAITRGQRNKLQDEIYEILKSYRLALPTFFAKDDPLVTTLPRLSPLPGHTPDPVTLSGQWDPGAEMANLSWTESTDSSLARYEIRMSPGPNYLTEDESVIGTVEPGSPLTFSTNSGLTAAGLTAGFRVYVVLTTGNEKGSNDLIIARPVPE